ncbi:hypothetical protein C8J57DRAFT_1335847 [Mycena rebaudengoi]|nr:hypothetical protein C8J57DRAFT_1335847 [Mycena rebaudengoi]
MGVFFMCIPARERLPPTSLARQAWIEGLCGARPIRYLLLLLEVRTPYPIHPVLWLYDHTRLLIQFADAGDALPMRLLPITTGLRKCATSELVNATHTLDTGWWRLGVGVIWAWRRRQLTIGFCAVRTRRHFNLLRRVSRQRSVCSGYGPATPGRATLRPYRNDWTSLLRFSSNPTSRRRCRSLRPSSTTLLRTASPRYCPRYCPH